MEKIDSLARLTQLLSNNLKDYNIILQTLLNTNKAKEPRGDRYKVSRPSKYNSFNNI